MLPALVTGFLLLAATSVSGKDYSGAQVLSLPKVPLVNDLVRMHGLSVWSRNSSVEDVLVEADKVSAIKDLLTSYGVNVGVKISDVGAAIRASNPPESRTRSLVSRSGGMSWDRYHRLADIHGYLDQLAGSYPQIASVGVLGYSHERRPLKYIKISSGKPNAKAVWIDGGIHAREWISPASVSWAIKELVENRKSLPKELLDVDFYVLPVLNPDGYEYTHTSDRMWRKNRRPGSRRGCEGVDLNRNFPIHWAGKGTSKDPCSELYVGPSAGSEPETQAVMKFITSLRSKLAAYLTFHSYAQMILIPYAHDSNQRAENYNELLSAGQKAAAALRSVEGKRYNVGNTVELLSAGAGGSEDWAKGALGIRFAFCVELRDTGDSGFLLPTRQIQPTAREAFEAIKTIASIATKV